MKSGNLSPKEKAMRQIRGLLAKSVGNTTPEESQACMAKARELLALYRLSMNDVELQEESQKETIKQKTNVSCSRAVDPWIAGLGNLVADYHRCGCYFLTPWRGRKSYVCFMGYEDDVFLAENLFYYSRHHIYTWINEYRKEWSEQFTINQLRPDTDAYGFGFVAGLKERYEKQNRDHPDWALVLVKPDAIIKAFDEMSIRNFSSMHKLPRDSYEEGYEDGKKFRLDDKLEAVKLEAHVEG